MRITCRRPQTVPVDDDGFIRKWYVGRDSTSRVYASIRVAIYQWIPSRPLAGQLCIVTDGFQDGHWVDRGRATLRDGETFHEWYCRQLNDGRFYASILDPDELVDKFDQLYAFIVKRPWADDRE